MITFERFEAAKIKRFISRYKKPYIFRRNILNACEEPTGDFIELCTIDAVYHEAKYNNLKVTESGGGSFIADASEIEPMLLCLKDANSDTIKSDDEVFVNGIRMIVTRIKDINNSGFAYDISLRVVDDGSKA